ncbi:MAG: hypothetical protein N3F07_02225 [Candidatus Micrarchaeota archaeon]|nr:hypothetical protein [Candidatus Micrarchaeota archaeon]
MAILKASSMPKLALSQDPKDKAILEFAERKSLRFISYKDYKYLYCLLCVESISLAVGGDRLADRDGAMELWLSIARADRATEIYGKAKERPKGLPEEEFKRLKPLLESEVRASNLSELVEVRMRLGEEVSKLLIRSVNGEAKQEFWRSITVAMMLLDTLSDMVKDRMEGLVKRLNIAGVLKLAKNLAKASFDSVRQIGIAKSIKLLAIPSLMTIKGGFERESRKEKPWDIFGILAMKEGQVRRDAEAPAGRT